VVNNVTDRQLVSSCQRTLGTGFIDHEAALVGMHNRVYVWVGGDMGSATSPNDPVFYLNHFNVDRFWVAWLVNEGRICVPSQSESAELAMHRLDDPMYSILMRQPITTTQMLDVSEFYTYDVLPSIA
jgi:tyrosinase